VGRGAGVGGGVGVAVPSGGRTSVRVAMTASGDGSSPELTTNQKGAIAEAVITSEAIKLGFDVYRPAVEGGRYDLIFGLGAELIRVQCKWARREGEVVNVRLQTSRRTRGGVLLRRSYAADEIDAVAAYCPDLGRCYLVPVDLVAGRRCLLSAPLSREEQPGSRGKIRRGVRTTRGYSSVGRALAWHARGRRFESG
jgi:hypothetical protein